jgi:hypothetical protein
LPGPKPLFKNKTNADKDYYQLLRYLYFPSFQGSAVLAVLIQRRFAQLDENGTVAVSVRDKVHEADRRQKPYEQKLKEYREQLLELPDLV